MSNGVKIGLLGVIAVLLGFTFFKLFTQDGTDQSGKPIQPSTAGAQAAGNTVQAADGQWYYPGPDGKADLSRPMDVSKKDQKAPAVTLSENRKKTTIKFDKLEHDFGTIKEGDRVEYNFHFTNTGQEPLIIEKADATCGCTVPLYPKDPIPAGQGGDIRVSFDSKGKKNKQSKFVTVTANTEPLTTKLNITADVIPDPNAPAAPVKPNIGGH